MRKTTEILERWMELDAQLWAGRQTIAPAPHQGLDIDEFAEGWEVSERTLRRDLDAFVELGLQLEYARCYTQDDLTYRWAYSQEQEEPLFCATLSGGGRKNDLGLAANPCQSDRGTRWVTPNRTICGSVLTAG